MIENLSFDHNITGYPFNIVPNIVHYILFDVKEVQFGHFISLLSVLKNQKPDLIYIHCNCHYLSGDYYQRVLRVANKTNTPIVIRNIERPTEIFGKNLSDIWLNWHSSDITRLRVLQQFGGIYLDRDVYVVQPLNVFLKYEMTINWGENQFLENSLLIAHKNARFLKLWLDSYHNYDPNQWYFNGGEMPTQTILYKTPELIHRVKGQFGSYGIDVCPVLYNSYAKDWSKDYYAIHLLIRGNELSMEWWCFNGNVPKIVSTFNDTNVRQLNVTFGEMSRILLDFELNYQ